MKRVHAVVHGRVQGVGFRYFTAVKARQFDIRGFVRNRADGTVEIEAEGEPGRLDLFLQAVRQGPSYAHVIRVDVSDMEPVGEPGFSVTG